MEHTYRVKQDTVWDEEQRAHIAYGIEAVGPGDEILLGFAAVFFERQRAERFASLCNDGGLSLAHFPDAVEDALAQ